MPQHVASQARQYRLSERVLFYLTEDGKVTGQIFNAVFDLSVDLHRVLLEFAHPATISEVAERLGLGSELEGVLALPISRGILVPVLPDATRAPLLDLVSPAFAELLEDPGKLRSHLTAGKACVIRNAFRPDFAKAAAASLDRIEGWALQEQGSQFSGGISHAAPVDIVWPKELTDLRFAMADPQTKQLMAGLTGRDCSGAIELNFSRSLPGDYFDPHDDNARNRQVSLTWYLSGHWDPKWGGHFYWSRSHNSFLPEFNSLVLFAINGFKTRIASNHFVTPVSPEAVGKRLAVLGWWTAEVQDKFFPETPRISESKNHGWYAGPEMEEIHPGVFSTRG